MKTFKRILLITIILGIMAGVYFIFVKPIDKMRGVYLVPKDAAVILAIDDPLRSWNDIMTSSFIKEMQENPNLTIPFAKLTEADKTIKKQQKILNILNVKNMLISAHSVANKQTDLLYVLDLEKASNFTSLSKYMAFFLKKKYEVTRRSYKDYEIIELFHRKKRNTTYLSFIKNQLIASGNHVLIESSIDQHQEPVIGRDLDFIKIKEKIMGKGILQIYIQYKYLDDLLFSTKQQSQVPVRFLCNSLNYTGLALELSDKKTISLEGYTNLQDSINPLFRTLMKSKNGKKSVCSVIPQRTTFYISMVFDDFKTFYSNMVENIESSQNKQSKEYLATIDELENKFEINMHDDFIDLIDDEIIIASLAPPPGLKETETAFIMKTKNGQLAEKKLDYICKQIKKHTPLKFKEYNHQGYKIRYISAGWFLKLLFGNALEKLDKPYYIIMDDHIIFSDLPHKLKSIINDYEKNKTLDQFNNYVKLEKVLKNKGSVYFYIQPLLLTTDNENNKEPLNQIGLASLQMINNDELLATRLLIQPSDNELKDHFEAVKNSIKINQASNQNLTEEVDDIFAIRNIYIDDLDASSYTKYYDSGEKMYEVDIKNGKIHGRYKAWYKNGELKIKGSFRDGKKEGTWKAYSKEGEMIDKINFSDGQLQEQ